MKTGKVRADQRRADEQSNRSSTTTTSRQTSTGARPSRPSGRHYKRHAFDGCRRSPWLVWLRGLDLNQRPMGCEPFSASPDRTADA
jgi:hypothetical protein